MFSRKSSPWLSVCPNQPSVIGYEEQKSQPVTTSPNWQTFFEVSEDVIKGLDPIKHNTITVHVPDMPIPNHPNSGLADLILSEILGEDEDVNDFLESIRHDPERKKLFKRSGKSGINEVAEANAILDALKNARDGQ